MSYSNIATMMMTLSAAVASGMSGVREDYAANGNC
jgi:hypothetical protein